MDDRAWRLHRRVKWADGVVESEMSPHPMSWSEAQNRILHGTITRDMWSIDWWVEIDPFLETSSEPARGHYCDGMTEAWSDAQDSLGLLTGAQEVLAKAGMMLRKLETEVMSHNPRPGSTPESLVFQSKRLRKEIAQALVLGIEGGQTHGR